MVRILAFLVGIGFVSALLAAVIFSSHAFPEETAITKFHKEHREVAFASDGPFGKFDKPQLQRGLQIYREVCSACHSMARVRFSDLVALGYTPGQVKTLATEWPTETPSLNPATGEAATRKSTTADMFPSPFANEVAARAANNNALPPDLSLITKAREGGAAYVYSLLTGYSDAPANLPKDARPGPGLHYNPYFANLNLSMTPPLVTDGQVTYGAGAPKPTVDQMAKDVAAFLIWTAEPKLENRHSAGLASLIFLLFFAGLCWMSYKSIWADKKAK